MVVTMSPRAVGVRLEQIVRGENLDADRGPDGVGPVAEIEGRADAGDTETRRGGREARQRAAFEGADDERGVAAAQAGQARAIPEQAWPPA